MKITTDGWAEQEHAWESVPAAMYNAMKAARDRESDKSHWFTSRDEWAERIAETERQQAIFKER